MPITAQTLQAIGDAAHVSKMTVSRALRNKPGVSKELREKILAIAEDLGYRPNPLITALMSNIRVRRSRPSTETGTIVAFVERARRLDEARHEHFNGAAEAAEKQGFKLERFIEGEAGLTSTRLNSILLARNIRGLIIAPLPEGQGYFNLDWNQFCLVSLEYTFENPRETSSLRSLFDRVVHDNYASMRMVMEKCRSRGLSRIGLLLTENGRRRTMGLYEAAYWMEQKTTPDFAAIAPLILNAWNENAFDRWMRKSRPEVIVTSKTLFSPLNAYLGKHGIRVPEDLSLINVNTDFSTSGIEQNNLLIGATAMRLLIDKINQNDCGIPEYANTVLVPGIWAEGNTLRAAPGV